jgi:hypothetical protein
MAKRVRVWEKLACEWKLDKLPNICRLVQLSQLDDEIAAMLAGRSKGRCVVDMEEVA